MSFLSDQGELKFQPQTYALYSEDYNFLSNTNMGDKDNFRSDTN